MRSGGLAPRAEISSRATVQRPVAVGQRDRRTSARMVTKGRVRTGLLCVDLVVESGFFLFFREGRLAQNTTIEYGMQDMRALFRLRHCLAQRKEVAECPALYVCRSVCEACNARR